MTESLHPLSAGLIALFILGYALITFEHLTKLNKATVALFTAVACWSLIFIFHGAKEPTLNTFCEGLSNISQVILFLIGALTVIETINAHHGFDILAQRIETNSKKKLLWLVTTLTFFLSSILDNLTTTVVMVTIMRKIIPQERDRWLMGGAIVIAANAGGAWTPIGDVTTTMLWIGGQLTTMGMMWQLFLPSIICMAVANLLLTPKLVGTLPASTSSTDPSPVNRLSWLMFALGIALLIFVPIFKVITGLPPFMGMLLALSILWIVTDLIHRDEEASAHLRIPYVLTKIDLSGILFFLGILLAIEALHFAGILTQLAHWFDTTIGNKSVIAILIGLASAIIDNIPLVAAAMGMYDLSSFPTDSPFWQLIAYCAGTGGSILIIGSAAGVVFMGMERVNFFWFLRHISLAALAGYLAGALYYIWV